MKVRKLYNKLKKLTTVFSKKPRLPSVLVDKSILLFDSERAELTKNFKHYCKQNGLGVRK